MTHAESLMLTICFCVMMGYFIGNIIALIRFALDDHKKKKRKCAEDATRRESPEE